MSPNEDFIDIAERIGHDLFCVQMTYDTLMDLHDENHDAAMARIESALNEGDATCYCEKTEAPAGDQANEDDCPLPEPEAWEHQREDTVHLLEIGGQSRCGVYAIHATVHPSKATCTNCLAAHAGESGESAAEADDPFEAMDQTGRGVSW